MTKQEMIEYVLDGHITDICEWVARDMDSLNNWLEMQLKLDDMTEGEIRNKYGAYLVSAEELEEEFGDD